MRLSICLLEFVNVSMIGVDGHDSMQDAAAAMLLAIAKVWSQIIFVIKRFVLDISVGLLIIG